MTLLAPGLKGARARQKVPARLSPFELNDHLIGLAADAAKASACTMLKAVRGNPNWIATEPREAFFLLGSFAMTEARRGRDDGILAGMPAKAGIARRFLEFLDDNRGQPGERFLRGTHAYGFRKKGFVADAFVHEMVDAIIGGNYPMPDRMLAHAEQIVHDYLVKELCGGDPPKGRFDLFAVEGATAAICYILDSLMHNGLLARGDTIAFLQPVFTPYIEIAALERFNFNVVAIHASCARGDGSHSWHYLDSELDRLADPAIKLLVCVNPGNPPSITLSAAERRSIARAVKRGNPGLVIVTDDVYATFVEGFRSLMADMPENVIGVYSFSKNSGCTGWRLGVVAVHERNVMDRRIAAHTPAWTRKLERRYVTLSPRPGAVRFIDRMVADSRCVALKHTAGLSPPQQLQMMLFALAHLLDETDEYKKLTLRIVQQRRDMLWSGLGIPAPPPDPGRAWYYVELDLEVWARHAVGEGFFEYLRVHHEAADFLLRLARESSIVLLDGGGCGGPEWSVRVSLASLDDQDYARIGAHMRAAARDYVDAWRRSGA